LSTPASVKNEASRAVACSQCNLRKLCLPKGLTHAETKRLERTVEYRKTFEPDEYLYEQGAPLRFLYIVRSGSAKSLVASADGAEQIIGFHLPGELLGLDALEHRCHTSSAMALETTNVCALSYERFDQLCTNIPHLHVEVMMEAAKILADDHELLLVMGKKKQKSALRFFYSTCLHE
jgi:CRP/FNR family transcriptional regulator, anaerobic regulatory protein